MPRPALPQALRSWLPSWWRPAAGSTSKAGGPSEDPLLTIGREMRRRREERGLNLRQLALETRISTTVLEALERGWRERLPEAAYLRTMLPLLERHLALEPGSLEVALPASSAQANPLHRRPGMRNRRFTPGSIDVFSSWQGTVLYGLITLGLIYGINLQQQRLAASNRLSLVPIQPLSLGEQSKPPAAGTNLLKVYPDLRPLGQAEAGVALSRLRADSAAQKQRPGLLELELAEASRLTLSSSGALRTSLAGASGSLALPLQPPFEINVEPAPKAGSVRWNGTPLNAVAGQPGRFQRP
ncbi:MAG: helix-turn-helix domain-containing protein [Prochlorococcaceae cyanobacterium]